MHDDEIATDAALVRRLLDRQFPRWAALDIEPIASDGTDNAIYRLGEALAARLPRRPSAVAPIDKEHAWLPRLAPQLPLPVSTPLAKGAPSEDYPWPWAVCRWVEGRPIVPDRVEDQKALARQLASFIRALAAIDAADGPGPGVHSYGRGAGLAAWAPTIAARLERLADLDDLAEIAAAWQVGAQTPKWRGAPTWVHGDLKASNLLERGGLLSGVIDWSCLAAGDPACDLQVAWTVLDRDGRDAFRRAVDVDDDTWMRGQAWALLVGILNLSYYRGRSPPLAAEGRAAIDAVLADRAPRA